MTIDTFTASRDCSAERGGGHSGTPSRHRHGVVRKSSSARGIFDTMCGAGGSNGTGGSDGTDDNTSVFVNTCNQAGGSRVAMYPEPALPASFVGLTVPVGESVVVLPDGPREACTGVDEHLRPLVGIPGAAIGLQLWRELHELA